MYMIFTCSKISIISDYRYDLKSFDIHYTSFPHAPYTLLPPNKDSLDACNFCLCFYFHFHRILFCGSLREPRKYFSNSHLLVCLITHSFLSQTCISSARNTSWPLVIFQPISTFDQNLFWSAKFTVHIQWDSNQ